MLTLLMISGNFPNFRSIYTPTRTPTINLSATKTRTPTITPTWTPPPPTHKLNFEVMNSSGNGSCLENGIKWKVKITNWDTVAIPIASITVRVWFNTSKTMTTEKYDGRVYNSSGTDQGTFSTVSSTETSIGSTCTYGGRSANKYVTVSFSGGPNIPANGGYLYMDGIVRTFDWSQLDAECDDYTRLLSTWTSYVNEPSYTLYEGINLVCEWINASTLDANTGINLCTGGNGCGGATATWTRTTVVTPKWTRIGTPTNTGIRTNTILPTGTMTRTVTPTWTRTGMRTNTPVTSTFTATATGTGTMTRTATPTWTRTGTRTNTPVTSTFTITPTHTAPPTGTWTRTATGTNTMTSTHSITSTWTRTFTPTFTCTSTMTNTPTMTVTGTSTRTYTPTWTSTSTFTRNPTPSTTGTTTQTFTLTPTSTPEKQEITDVKPYPNPVNPDKNAELRIGFKIAQTNVDKVIIRIYTSGYRLIKEVKYEGAQAVSVATQGFASIYVKDLILLANGTYYYYIKADRKGDVCKSKIDKIIILR